MGMKALVCPACGGDIQLDDNHEFGFCSYNSSASMAGKI